ncbi:MAG: vWA domain-containing protein [Oligoflexales bacterium]
MKLARDFMQHGFFNLILVMLMMNLISCGGASFSSQNSQSTKASSSDNVVAVEAVEEVKPFEQEEPPPPPPPVKKEEPLEPLNETLMLSCESTDEVHTITAKANQEISLSFSGEICPKPLAQDPRILFIVDVSGSMGDFFLPNGTIRQGADNFENGTCGRYEAIKAILEKTKSGTATQSGRAGVVLFGSGIHENSIEFTSLEQFEAQIRPESICIADDGTNYEQAFTTAKEWLDAEDGTLKVAYFISDGEPTEIIGNPLPFGDLVKITSIAAGKAFTKANSAGVSPKLFQVFLGTASPKSLEVMEAIAGDNKDLIQEVEKASDLATVLTDFSIVELEMDNLKITAKDATSIKVTRFEELEKGASAKWSWQAENLSIPGDTDQFQIKLELVHDNIETISITTNIEITRE